MKKFILENIDNLIYSSEYRKKFIIISVVIIVLVILLLFKNLISYSIGNLNIVYSKEKQGFLYNEKNIKWLDKFDYYQLYITPSKYNIECVSKLNQEDCNIFLNNKDFFSKYIYSQYVYNIKNWLKWEINLFPSIKDNNFLIKDIFKHLWESSFINRYSKEVSKYLDENYLKWDNETNNTNEVFINDLEFSCIERIKNSMPESSFEYEKLVSQKINEECKIFRKTPPLQIVLWWPEKKWILWITIKITEFEGKILVFNKEWKEYKQKKSKITKIPTNIEIKSWLDLKEMIN